MDRREQEAAAMVLRLFDRASYGGYVLSNMERLRTGGLRDLTPNEAATNARRVLAAIQRRLAAEHWSVIWHVLFMTECHRLYAIRAHCRKAEVKARLWAALQAVAALSHCR